ncbi:hypothetical protein BZM27_55035 [Paraburkholderia steynii]|uniref:Uncharacterized protein n=1 Tax=Paraburkholderia steynii TaxID=1245441 RepID=A0A4R0WT75_9BURK|nr:hypothetical protein BZM27_55035 [Paraburkholderia steynii]
MLASIEKATGDNPRKPLSDTGAYWRDLSKTVLSYLDKRVGLEPSVDRQLAAARESADTSLVEQRAMNRPIRHYTAESWSEHFLSDIQMQASWLKTPIGAPLLHAEFGEGINLDIDFARRNCDGSRLVDSVSL